MWFSSKLRARVAALERLIETHQGSIDHLLRSLGALLRRVEALERNAGIEDKDSE